MSHTPKPDKRDSGQVRSLTQHRAEKDGKFEPSVYDVSYRKGERITCDESHVAYYVRIGRVRVQKQLDTHSGSHLVTVDFLDKDEPLLVSRFIPNVKDDPDLQFYADSDVIIGEIPIESIGRMFDATDFLRTFSRLMTRHTYSLRGALYKQLERYQQMLETLEAQKGANASLQHKLDDANDDDLGHQMRLGDLERELAAERELLVKAVHEAEGAKAELKTVREREKSAITKAREAFEYFQSLEQRQCEESRQFPEVVNDVLEYFDLPRLPVNDLMFVITSARTKKQPEATKAVRNPDDALFSEKELADLAPEIDIGNYEDAAEDEWLPFEAEAPTGQPGGNPSGYCLVGDQIPRDEVVLQPEADDGDRHTPTLPPPEAILARIETQAISKIPVRKPAQTVIQAARPSTGLKVPRPNPPIARIPVTMASPRSYPWGREGVVASYPEAKPEPSEEEAPTSKGMAPISCPIGAPFADIDEVVQPTTKALDVSDFRPPAKPKK